LEQTEQIKSEVQQKRHELKEVVNLDGNPKELYAEFKLIGTGSFGRTFRAISKRTPESKVVAIKQIRLSIDNCGPLATEISIMKSCTHPNIITYYDSFLLDEENELWIVMEFMEYTSMTQIIHLFDELRMDEPHMAYCLREVITSSLLCLSLYLTEDYIIILI